MKRRRKCARIRCKRTNKCQRKAAGSFNLTTVKSSDCAVFRKVSESAEWEGLKFSKPWKQQLFFLKSLLYTKHSTRPLLDTLTHKQVYILWLGNRPRESWWVVCKHKREQQSGKVKLRMSGSEACILLPVLHCTCLPSSQVVLSLTEVVLWLGSPIFQAQDSAW